MTEKSESHPDLRNLVLEAFRIAANQGKPEWHRMRGTVLKNRMLDLTQRTFDEADYGADRFGELVERLDELLAVDHSAKPFLVELREPFRSEVQTPDIESASSRGRMVRSDLWQAIVDYSHGKQWLWDQAAVKAVPVQEGRDSLDGHDLPTLDKHVLHAWRTEFAEELLAGMSGAEATAIGEWASKDLGTAALPKQLRARWNARDIQRAASGSTRPPPAVAGRPHGVAPSIL